MPRHDAILKHQKLRDAGVERKLPGAARRRAGCNRDEQPRFIDLHRYAQAVRHGRSLREWVDLYSAVIEVEAEGEMEQKVHPQNAADIVIERAELRERHGESFQIR